MLSIMMPEGQAAWLWRLDGQDWHSANTIEQLIADSRAQYSGHEATVFFPSQHAQFFSQPLSRQQFKKLGVQGVGYLIEDMTIDAVDHLTIFAQHAVDEVHLMAIPQSLRATYQNSLGLLPWTVRALLPDFLVLPVPETGEWTIAQIFDRQLVRWSAWRGWVWEQVDFFGILDIENAQSQTFQTLASIKFYGVAESLQQQIIAVLSHDGVATTQADESGATGIQWQAFAELPFERPNIRHPFNILQKKSTATPLNGYWTACVVVLCLAVMTQAIYDGMRWWRYQKLANETAELAIHQYKMWFPDEAHISEQNLRSKFKAKIQANAAADRHALELLSRVGPILQQMNVSAQQVNYQNNILSMDVIAHNSDMVNQLATQLKQQGLNVNVGNIQNQGTGIVGTLKIQ